MLPIIKGNSINKKPQKTFEQIQNEKHNALMLELEKSLQKTNNLIQEIQSTENSIISLVNSKTSQLDAFIEETGEYIKNTKNDCLNIIKNIKKGDTGKDAKQVNTQKLVDDVLKQIPTLNEQKITKNILSKLPIQKELDENKLLARLVSKIPEKKGDLKIIQEKVETDPMSVIDKIMELANQGKIKFKTDTIDGLEQTMSAFRSQLGRGYLHGGGLSKVIHDTTLSGDGTPENPLKTSSSTSSIGSDYIVKVATTNIITGLIPVSNVIDGNTLVVGDKVLVWSQATLPSQNGVYVFNGVGVAMTRATDFNTDAQIRGASVRTLFGGNNGRTVFFNTNPSAITIGTTAILFSKQITPGGGLQQYTNQTLSLTDTGVIPNIYGAASIVPQFIVDAQGRLTLATNNLISISTAQIYDYIAPTLKIGLLKATHDGRLKR